MIIGSPFFSSEYNAFLNIFILQEGVSKVVYGIYAYFVFLGGRFINNLKKVHPRNFKKVYLRRSCVCLGFNLEIYTPEN